MPKAEIIKKNIGEVLQETYLEEEKKYIYSTDPFIDSTDELGEFEAQVDGKRVGFQYQFPLNLYIKGKEEKHECGSTLGVDNDARKYMLGFKLPRVLTQTFAIVVSATVSDEARAVDKMLKFSFFDMNRYICINGCRFALEHYLPKVIAKSIAPIINIGLHLRYNAYCRRIERRYKQYEIKEYSAENADLTAISEIIKSDDHPYKEAHNEKWLKWVLGYKPNDSRSRNVLYEIKKDGEVDGFFINKLRFRDTMGEYTLANPVHNVMQGTIMEWGVAPSSDLTEADVLAIALSKFGTAVDMIDIIITDDALIKHIPSSLRIRHGFVNYAVHIDRKKFPTEYPGIENMKNWRLRPAGGDNPF